jgi:hypothetical protein
MNSLFIDSLISDIKSSENTYELCRVLVDASFGEDNSLSDEQFDILTDIFTDSEIAAAIIMFLHNFEEFNYDLEKIKILYDIVHDKFHENVPSIPINKNIIA